MSSTGKYYLGFRIHQLKGSKTAANFYTFRGTYTTQAHTKRNVRKGEFLMHDIEYLDTFASLKSDGYKYPKETIDELWENLLL